MTKRKPTDEKFYGMTLTDEQKDMVDAIYDEDVRIVFVDSVAGSGKTTIAVGCANVLVHQPSDKYRQLDYLFSTPCEDKTGFRPGTREEKEAAYLQPLYDAVCEIGETPERCIQEIAEISNLKNGNAWVSAHSINFMRGSNIKNRVVIIDEAQNMTVHELKMVLTRIHDSAKVIVIGHTGQIDIEHDASGFSRYLEHYRNEEYCRVCNLTKNFRGKIAAKADELKFKEN